LEHLQAVLVVNCLVGKWAVRQQYCYVRLAVLADGAGGDAVTWWWRGAFRLEVRGGLDCCWTLWYFCCTAGSNEWKNKCSKHLKVSCIDWNWGCV
jgi:hypothetical protein